MPPVEIPKRRRRPFWRDLCQSVLATGVVLVLAESFLLQGFRVYGSCMEPNLYTGERLLGNKVAYWVGPPTRGDVIVFRYPPDPARIYVKRVIGLPGDMVAIRGGHVLVNGQALPEAYVAKVAHGDYPEVRVPSRSFFVLGDNRDHSSDSREWGVVPEANIEGKAWIRYWPPERMGLLR